MFNAVFNLSRNITVGVGYCFLNGINEHPRALGNPENPRALCNNVDYIFAIDGRYKFYNIKGDNSDYSTDGSYEFIEKTYPNAIMDKYSGLQTEKRQRYLDLAGKKNQKFDFLLVIDSDQYIDPRYQDWEKFYGRLIAYNELCPKENLFYMWCYMNPLWKKAYNKVRNNTWKRYMKIHKDPWKFRFAIDRHFWWTKKHYTDEYILSHPKSKLQEVAVNVVDGVRINSDSTIRTAEQLRARQEWARTQMDFENYQLGDKIMQVKGKPVLSSPFQNMR